jgi:hypothetical protein
MRNAMGMYQIFYQEIGTKIMHVCGVYSLVSVVFLLINCFDYLQ